MTLYIRQNRMNCSLATLQMTGDRLGVSPTESQRLFITHGNRLSLYSPGDICLLFQRMGIDVLLLESPSFEEISDRCANQPAIVISFLVPMGHYLLVEKSLENRQLLVSDPLGCYPYYGRGIGDGYQKVYNYEIAIAAHIGMPYWFICFGENGSIPDLLCGYTVGDVAFKNRTLTIRNGEINYLSREVNTTLGFGFWQGWKMETIKALADLCQNNNIQFNNQITNRVANLIIREFTHKWRRLNSMQVR